MSERESYILSQRIDLSVTRGATISCSSAPIVRSAKLLTGMIIGV